MTSSSGSPKCWRGVVKQILMNAQSIQHSQPSAVQNRLAGWLALDVCIVSFLCFSYRDKNWWWNCIASHLLLLVTVCSARCCWTFSTCHPFDFFFFFRCCSGFSIDNIRIIGALYKNKVFKFLLYIKILSAHYTTCLCYIRLSLYIFFRCVPILWCVRNVKPSRRFVAV